MSKLVIRAAISILTLVSAATMSTAYGQSELTGEGRDRASSGRLIVRRHDLADFERRARAGAEAAASRYERAYERHVELTLCSIPAIDAVVLRVPDDMTDHAFAEELLASGDYRWVEPDSLVPAAATPNDPAFPVQWHLDRIGAPLAWDLETGSPAVVVAVLDSGVDAAHPDLQARLVSGFNAVDGLPESSGGLTNGLTNHGTQVAGVIAAAGNNGVDGSGVGWNLSVMPVRVRNIPDDAAFISTINAGAIWAAENGARVVNASFSGVVSNAVADTGEYLRSLDVHYVWAAGNAFSPLDGFDPADVVVVGATDFSDGLASFSNFGDAVDLVAPGVDIETTSLAGGFGPIDGTSFSAPVVSGALALLHSAVPGLSSEVAEFVLETTCVDLGAPGPDSLFGAGRVDLAAAVQLAVSTVGADFAPVARDDVATLVGGGPLTIDVLQNDIDLDGDLLQIAGHDFVSAGGGAVSIAGSELLYSPAAGFEGADTFTYTCADPSFQSSTAICSVRVAAPPQISLTSTAQLPPGTIPEDFELVDLDSDGDLDVVVVSGSFTASMTDAVTLLNDGAGNLQISGSASTTGVARHVEIADVDLDGHFDALVATSAGMVEIFLGDGQGGLAAAGAWSFGGEPTGLEVGDWDQDGFTDVAVSQMTPTNAVIVRRGLGAGAFGPPATFPTDIGAWGVVSADVTGDGIEDLLTPHIGFGRVSVLVGLGSANFAPFASFAVLQGADALDVRDLDDDGDLDLAIAHAGFLGGNAGVSTWRNNGSGAFSGDEFHPVFGTPIAVAGADLQDDGDIDLVYADLAANEAGLLIAAADFRLPAPGLATPFGVFGVRSADLTGDSKLDVIVLDSSGRLSVFAESGAPTPSFVRGDVDGSGSLDLGDGIRLLSHLFQGAGIDCSDAADLDDDGDLDLTDAIRLLQFLFAGGAVPPAPHPIPGPDPTTDGLSCGPSGPSGP